MKIQIAAADVQALTVTVKCKCTFKSRCKEIVPKFGHQDLQRESSHLKQLILIDSFLRRQGSEQQGVVCIARNTLLQFALKIDTVIKESQIFVISLTHEWLFFHE